MNLKLAGALAAAALTLPASALADEGMWTFDAFPSAKVEQSLGVRVDQKWLDRVQAASVRLTSGCSASLVSPDGLVLTNQHCVVECAQNLSSGEADYVKDSFLARTRGEERTCPGVQAEILLSITDVSAEITKVTSGLSGGDFIKARNAAYARLESEACGKSPQTRCQVISFYRGGQHKLYRYRKYADVRLVFAPELGAAFFGGDPDNFNFPRYALDVAFLRLYENGKVVRTPQHLTWAARAPLPGEATFVSGNPGSTDRLLTVAQLETQRDLALPVVDGPQAGRGSRPSGPGFRRSRPGRTRWRSLVRDRRHPEGLCRPVSALPPAGVGLRRILGPLQLCPDPRPRGPRAHPAQHRAPARVL